MKKPSDTPTRLEQVRKMIQKKNPLVDITRGNGYYYLFSDDDKTSIKLCGCYSTSIGVFHVSHLSYEQWEREIDAILDEAKHPDLYRQGKKIDFEKFKKAK